MPHVVASKRMWILLLPLCLHGLALTVGAIVWFVFALGTFADPTASATHLFRTPTVAETAGGRTWFTATSEELVALEPSDGAEPRWAANVGLANTSDPWAGCSIRRQHYTSGKNAAWHDDTAWSYGAYVLHDAHGKRVVVPLSFLASASRTELEIDEVSRLLPNETAPHATRYLRECFPASASVAVDGFVDAKGKLDRSADDGSGARIETPAETFARGRRGVAFQCVGLAAGLVPFAWLAAWVGFFRRPLALRKAVVSVMPHDAKAMFLRMALATAASFAFGLAMVATGRVAPVLLLFAFFGGSVTAFWNTFLWTAARTVSTFRDALVGASSTWRSAEGSVVAPEAPSVGAVTKRAHAFVQLETFELTSKGAVGRRVSKSASHPRIELAQVEGRVFVEASTIEVFGPFEELRLTGGELPALGIQGTFSRETRYLVRETTIDSGAVVSVVGDTTSEADPMARGEDYREAGKSTVFVAKDGKGPLAFAHGRATVLAQANKDLATLGLLRGVAFAFALAIPSVPILAVVLGR